MISMMLGSLRIDPGLLGRSRGNKLSARRMHGSGGGFEGSPGRAPCSHEGLPIDLIDLGLRGSSRGNKLSAWRMLGGSRGFEDTPNQRSTWWRMLGSSREYIGSPGRTPSSREGLQKHCRK